MKKILKIIIFLFDAHLKGFLMFFKPNKIKIKLQIPKSHEKINDEKICKRVFESFKKMKNNEKKNSPFSVSSQWRKHIDNDFYPMKQALEKNNFEQFQNFLNNFGNWNKYLGIEEHKFVQNCSKNFLLRNYLSNYVFKKQLNLWEYFNSYRKNRKFLNTPRHGNQIGAFIDNKYFTTLASFSNEIIANNLLEIIKSQKKAVVTEIGAGYGQLAYFLSKNRKICFIDVDIPETLSLAAYYLMKCFPQKKIYLYGEKDFNLKNILKYDFIFLPHYKMNSLKNKKIDLVINKNSFGEMYPKTVKAYIKIINECTRYFFHMNHSVFKNKFLKNKKGLLSNEYPLSKKFKMLCKYPDFLHLIWIDGKVRLENDIFCHLYEKEEKRIK